MEDDWSGEAETPEDAGAASSAALYGQHFDNIYDFSLRLSQDRDMAALVVQSSFLSVFRDQAAGRVEAPELQLYSNAHHDVAARLRSRRGEWEQVEEPYAAMDASMLSTPVGDTAELGRMVWSAAVELKLNDYELLDLNVRQRLDASQIGFVLGQRQESVERKLADAQSAFERAIGSRLLYTRGRRECLDLDVLIGDAEWSDSLARRIWRHSESCPICRGTATTLPDAVELLAALMPVPAPAGWQETMFERLVDAAKSEPRPALSAAAVETRKAIGLDPNPEPASTPSPAPRPTSLPEDGGRGRGGGGSERSETTPRSANCW